MACEGGVGEGGGEEGFMVVVSLGCGCAVVLLGERRTEAKEKARS